MHYEVTNNTGVDHSVGPYTFRAGVSECAAPLPPEVLANLDGNAPFLTYRICGADQEPVPEPESDDPVSEPTFEAIRELFWKNAIAAVESLENEDLLKKICQEDSRPVVKKAAEDRLEELLEKAAEQATNASPADEGAGEEPKPEETSEANNVEEQVNNASPEQDADNTGDGQLQS